MKLLVREIRADEVEQEITQRDQFNTDTVGLAETLVREAHQNSMDGRSKEQGFPVRTRIQLVEPRAEDAAYWSELFEPLRRHLEASGIKLNELDLGKPRLLVVEDFGTTGLCGSVDKKDERNFSDFWRRTGRSHKRGEQGGRWGLGKLVFSSASRIRTFFGVTVQEEDTSRTPLLMGQAVLKHHRIEGNPPMEYAPHAFYAIAGANGLQVPEQAPGIVGALMAAAGLSRTEEPGLSIVVPFVHDDLTPEAMLPHIIRNWFFPILTGRLVVEVGNHVLDSDTFADLAKEFGGGEFADGRRVAFISELHAARSAPPSITLAHNWTSEGIAKALPTEVVESLRSEFNDGKLVAVRVPLTIRPQTGTVQPTHIDLYLRASPETARGEALFVRGAITIPGEARRFRGRNCFGALIAEEKHVAAFLGDAEGPAHTTWSGTAEKVRENWKNASERLREIREALNQFHELVARLNDRMDPDALKKFFNVPQSGQTKTIKKRSVVIVKPKVPPIPRKPASYRVDARKGGFVVRSTGEVNLPMDIRLKTAYDVVDGDPINQHSKYDFDLTSGDIHVECEGANYEALSANELQIEIMSSNFSVALSGFDENRDLFVRDRKV